jgi:hypothetical protein
LATIEGRPVRLLVRVLESFGLSFSVENRVRELSPGRFCPDEQVSSQAIIKPDPVSPGSIAIGIVEKLIEPTDLRRFKQLISD